MIQRIVNRGGIHAWRRIVAGRGRKLNPVLRPTHFRDASKTAKRHHKFNVCFHNSACLMIYWTRLFFSQISHHRLIY
jgi:hypothetical protein